MNLKKIVGRIISLLLSISFLIALVCLSSPILERKDGRLKFDSFYEHSDDYDILFLGSSHVMKGINPIELWEHYGYTSYNMGVDGCRLGMTYWIMKNALEFSEPELLVLDCAYLKDEKASVNKEYNHCFLDSMRDFSTKISAIFDLFDNAKDRIRYLFPFTIYHNRWNELSTQDFEKSFPNDTMGYTVLTEARMANVPGFNVNNATSIDNESTRYLEKIIFEAKQANIPLLLTFLPFSASDVSINDAAFIREIANDYGLDYIGPEELISILDTSTDFADDYDDNSHLNLSGSKKLTYYLGDYINENFDISDRRGDSSLNYWNDLCTFYQQKREDILKSLTSPEAYLMFLSTTDYNAVIEVSDISVMSNFAVSNFLNNLNVDYSYINADTDCIIINCSEKTTESYDSFWDTSVNYESPIGNIATEKKDPGKTAISINGKAVCSSMFSHEDTGSIAITVLDSSSTYVIDSASFTLDDISPKYFDTAHSIASQAEIPSVQIASLLVQHNQQAPVFAASLADCSDTDALYVLPDGYIYDYIDVTEDRPEILIEELHGGFWYGDKWNPTGAIINKPDQCGKRTSVIPVSPGDVLSYRGYCIYTPDSVVWLDENKDYISDEKYDALSKAVHIIVPPEAHYAWFSSFQYTENVNRVILEVDWVKCQAVPTEYQWQSTGYKYTPYDNIA